ncbi:Putative pentatricopeptide repeat-containing protein [Apostasia shenzhenica]|uniref:Pentatricopeptide repeat-containing protein n=1 Tax=Apostasia shenzhenica TaxID=1088818 RepID=A0A2I0A3S7_9ASPA|nr:Putative pentatricopeptide repeat-containing protein [Apostasia shenzhenica]
MLMRWRRLLHSTSDRTNSPPRTSKSRNFVKPDCCQLRLCPEIVDSTISNCPSDAIALSFFLWCARRPHYFHTPGSFDRIIPVVRRLSQRFGLVSGIIRHLEGIGCAIKPQTFLILLRVYWRAQMHRFALEVFDEMRRRSYQPSTFVRNVVLDIQFKTATFDAAMRFFRETLFPNFLTFNIVLRNLCKSGDWIRVRDLLREMVRKGFCLNEGTFTMALDCFCKSKRHQELLQLFAFMVVLGRRPSVIIWTILINSLCQIGRVHTACEHLRKMEESGCSPTLVTYTSLVKGLYEAQMYSEVYSIVDVMHSNDCYPDLVLYNVVMYYLLKHGVYDVAIDLLLGLRERKMQPDSYTLSTLASALLSLGKISLLLDLTAGLNYRVDLVLYNSLISGYCRGGFPYEALELYNKMICRGLVPDSYSYVGLLSSLCMLGRTELAVGIYHTIVSSNPNVDAYVHAVILNGLVKNQEYHKAIKLFRKAVFENYHLDVVAYTIAIHGFIRCGRFEEANALFEQMNHFGPSPTIYTYNVMLCGFCKSRNWNRTKKLVRDMLITGVHMDCISMNAIAFLLIKLGRLDLACLLFKDLWVHGMMPEEAVLSKLFSSLHHACIVEPNALCCRVMNSEDSCFVENEESGFDCPQELLVSFGT